MLHVEVRGLGDVIVSLAGQTHIFMVMFESSQQPLHSWITRVSSEPLVWH